VLAKLKGELYDAWWLVSEARKVYKHVTGGATDRVIQRRTEALEVRIADLRARLSRYEEVGDDG
jgi:hypothetical protein